MVEQWNIHVPFALGGFAVLGAAAIIMSASPMLRRADEGLDEDGHSAAEHGDLADVVVRIRG